MGGKQLSLLLKRPPSEVTRTRAREAIASWGKMTVDADGGWTLDIVDEGVYRRLGAESSIPLGSGFFEPALPTEDAPPDRDALVRGFLGHLPQAGIFVFAFVRGKAAERAIVEVVLTLARSLGDDSSGYFLVGADAHITNTSGALYRFPYLVSENGESRLLYLIDAACLAAWLEEPTFVLP
jgi:hypothetical protein